MHSDEEYVIVGNIGLNYFSKAPTVVSKDRLLVGKSVVYVLYFLMLR